jgi:hypothetical protein
VERYELCNTHYLLIVPILDDRGNGRAAFEQADSGGWRQVKWRGEMIGPFSS